MKPELKRLRRIVNRYVRANEADSWKGGGDPDDHEAIERELVAAREACYAALAELTAVSLEAAYDAGFAASGEGWNGEYPDNAMEADQYKANRAEELQRLRSE